MLDLVPIKLKAFERCPEVSWTIHNLNACQRWCLKSRVWILLFTCGLCAARPVGLRTVWKQNQSKLITIINAELEQRSAVMEFTKNEMGPV